MNVSRNQPSVLLVGMLLASGVGAAPFLEPTFLVYPTGTDPSAVVTVDLNGDGLLDLAATDRADGTVSVLLGNGDRTFQTRTIWSVGAQPSALVAVDLDRDGRPDLVTANRGSGSISVLMGLGNGAYADQVELVVGAAPVTLAAGDLDGDMFPDLVVGDASVAAVSVLRGDGAGGFDAPVELAAASDVSAVALVDLNHDGRLDLLAAERSANRVSRWLGQGDGTFGTPVGCSSGPLPVCMEVADVNRDGNLDVIVGNGAGGTFSLVYSDAVGALSGPSTYGSTFRTPLVAAADLDLDGIPDIVATAPGLYSWSLEVWQGSGWVRYTRRSTIGPDDYPSAIELEDLDGDGEADLVVASAVLNALCIWRGGPGFALGGPIVNTGGTALAGFRAADVNADGRLDLVVTGPNRLGVMLRSDHGTFLPTVSYALTDEVFSPAVADLDADGWPDVGVANYTLGSISLFMGTGGGALGPRIDLPTGPNPRRLLFEDLDGDTDPDLLVVNGGADFVSVFLNHGDGTFEPRRDWSTGTLPYSADVGDVNQDGIADLVVLSATGLLTVRLGNGDGTFPVRHDAYAASYPVDVVLADLNSDTRLDLVISTHYGNVNTYLGHGDGTFAPPVAHPVRELAFDVEVADLNMDLVPDVVVACASGSTIEVLLGRGDGTLEAPVDFGIGNSPRLVQVVDWNADGLPDVAAASGGPPMGVAFALNGTDRPVAVTENALEATAESAGVRLRWNGAGNVFTGFTILRAEGVDPPADAYRVVGVENMAPGGPREYLDRDAPSGRTLAYEVVGRRAGGTEVVFGPSNVTTLVRALVLHPVRPNPARGAAAIEFELPRSATVELAVYDARGRLVSGILSGALGAGTHVAHWNGRDAGGIRVANGVYLVRLRTSSGLHEQRVTLLR